MAFHESASFPAQTIGSAGGPGFSTIFLDAKGGAQTRLGRWDGARRQYDGNLGVRTAEQAVEILSFYLAREGGLHGFRFKDWADFSTEALTWKGTAAFGDEIIGTGDGTTTQFQLVKRYTNGSVTRVRNLEKPVSGTVKSGVAGVSKTEGVHFTVDHTTGTVTYASAPTLGQQVTAGCQFDVPAHFAPGADALLSITMESFYAHGCPSIPIVEETSPSLVNDEFHYGGAFELAFSIPTQITHLMGRMASLTPGAATDLILVSAALLDPGGPYHVLANLSGANAITVKSGGATIGTLGTSTIKRAGVFLVSGVNTWKLY